jgi:hypothetical protein
MQNIVPLNNWPVAQYSSMTEGKNEGEQKT